MKVIHKIHHIEYAYGYKLPFIPIGYFKDYAKMIKEAVDIPVILIGGLRSKAVMDKMITAGYADMVSLSRPLIREPDLVVKFRDKGADRAQCISCNECFNENGVRCSFKKKRDRVKT